MQLPGLVYVKMIQTVVVLTSAWEIGQSCLKRLSQGWPSDASLGNLWHFFLPACRNSASQEPPFQYNPSLGSMV